MMKFPERCIFRESSEKLNKTHLFGKWLKKTFPDTYTKTAHTTSFLSYDKSSNSLKPNVKDGYFNNRPGGPTSKQLKLVCKSCNSGWISRIQSNAKEAVLDLLREQSILEDKLRSVAAFATLATMSIEFSDRKTLVTPQFERTWLKDHWIPPNNWLVFFGRRFEIEQVGAFWHRAGICPLPKPEDRVSAQPNIQSTTVSLGNMVIQTISGTTDILPDPLTYANKWGMSVIWPLKLFTLKSASNVPLTDISTAFWQDLGLSSDPHSLL